jgi:nickel-dependent lactate racemase
MLKNQSVRLAYGKHGIELKTGNNWNVTVIEPPFVKGLGIAADTITHAIQNPIGSVPLHLLVKPNDKVGIIFNDITRPTPNKLIIETILKELEHVPSSSIILFNALGTHRPNSDKEMRTMIGSYLVDNFRIVQNNAFDENLLEFIGTSSFGHEIWINKELMSCNIKILSGFIEPHFFAGFSGGGKAVMPGMAGIKTILGNHDNHNISNKYASWGETHNNPIWEEVMEVALRTGATFLVNVTMNRNKEITNVFAGNIKEAHNAGIEYVRQTAMVQVQSLFDIVVTTNSGYPLDLNLYQTVKGMSVAARVVKQGGIIIAAAECWDGIPDHGFFSQMLHESDSPAQLLETVCSPGFSKQDQWQAQILAMIQLKADVFLYTDNLSDDQLKIAKIKRCHNIHDLIEGLIKKLGTDVSICILPEGPQTIPFLAES